MTSGSICDKDYLWEAPTEEESEIQEEENNLQLNLKEEMDISKYENENI